MRFGSSHPSGPAYTPLHTTVNTGSGSPSHTHTPNVHSSAAASSRSKICNFIGIIIALFILLLIHSLLLSPSVNPTSHLRWNLYHLLGGTVHSDTCTTHHILPSREKPLVIQPPAAEVNVLITGGAGYLGSHMILLLLTHPDTLYNVVVIDDLSRGEMRHIRTAEALADSLGKKFTFYLHDMSNATYMSSLFLSHSIDCIIHFAGFAYPSESMLHPLDYYENLVTRTNNLLQAMEKAKVQRLVYSSTSAVYGTLPTTSSSTSFTAADFSSLSPRDKEETHSSANTCPPPSLFEFSPLTPVSPYGQAKLSAEQLIRNYATSEHRAGRHFSAALLRYFNVIGADPELRVGPLPKRELRPFGRIVDAYFNAVIDNTPLTIYGNDYDTPDGSAIRDYVHVMDLVEAHLEVMNVVHHNQVEPYNIGISHPYSVFELLDTLEKVTTLKAVRSVHPRRPGDPAIVVGSAHKITTELGWKPKWIDLEKMVKSHWNWRRKIETEAMVRREENEKRKKRNEPPLPEP